jgi:eukaryotic-like serine/threonine-protein kinase
MDEESTSRSGFLRIGRYALFHEIGAGGMSSVHFARLIGPIGFSRVVAIKRLHEHLAQAPEFAAALIDEAHLMARIRHPNVVSVLDVFLHQQELFVVMEYVPGETLARLLARATREGVGLPPALAATLMSNVLEGLHAAHTAVSNTGEALRVVHRDVSPENILVGADGLARVLDFGIAKAQGRLQWTNPGTVKGKASYMAPEQLFAQEVDHRADIYAVAGVLYECLTGRRLHSASVAQTIDHPVPPPSALAEAISPLLDRVVMRGLEKNRELRWASAEAFALALEEATGHLPARRVREWVTELAAQTLDRRSAEVVEIERTDIMTEGTGEPIGRAPIVPPEAPPIVPPKERRVAYGLAALALVGLAIAGLAASVGGGSREPPEASEPPARALVSVSPAPTSTVTAEAPRLEDHPPIAAPTPTANPPKAPKLRTSSSKRNCRVPYLIDERGIRRLKQQCL